MKQALLFFKFEALTFFRSNLFRVSVLLLLAVGIYAIYYGKTEMDRQSTVLAKIKLDETEKLQEFQAKVTTDTPPAQAGMRTYRLVGNPPTPWASLSVGQRDIFPYYIFLRMNALSSQITTSEIANPEKLLTGNFDFAFVLIYLFPLFIIAISYNMLSAEREGGTLSLLLSNPISERKISLFKVAFRAILTLSIALFLLLIAIFICELPINGTLFSWLLSTVLYITFWFGVVFAINNLQRNSAFNAFSLLGTWLVIVVVIPALTNLYLSISYASPPRNDLTQAIRHEYGEIWEKYYDKNHRYQTAVKLGQKYPELKSDTASNWSDKYSLASYDFYDEKLLPYFDKYTQLNQQKSDVGNAMSAFSAAALTQNIYNSLAQTDSKRHLQFQEEIRGFHTELKLFFYRYVYQNKTFPKSDFEKIPQFESKQNPAPKATRLPMLYLALSTLFVWTIGFVLIKK
ncbi:MAG: ABC-2 type transport system permease protein [Oceanospirillaceae bacterium]|jgi:ABC-2 type transport system permease protein